MDPSLLALICLLVAATLVYWLLRPEQGAFWRWRRLRQTTARVLREDILKHLHRCERYSQPASVESVAGAGAGVLFEFESASAEGELLRAGGWTLLTAVNVMLFSLIDNPSSTTLYTIYKETGSRRWTILAALLPLALGVLVTFLVTHLWRLIATW